jgi:hypothetical protein
MTTEPTAQSFSLPEGKSQCLLYVICEILLEHQQVKKNGQCESLMLHQLYLKFIVCTAVMFHKMK